MGKKYFKLGLAENIKRIDTTKGLYWPLLQAFMSALIVASTIIMCATNLYLFERVHISVPMLYFLFFFIISILPFMWVYCAANYKVRQGYLCAILVNVIESKKFCWEWIADKMASWLVQEYSNNLGIYTKVRDVEVGCAAFTLYQEAKGLKDKHGRWRRGAVAQQVKMISNPSFYSGLPKLNRNDPDFERKKSAEYHMKRRLFEQLSENGRKLFRTREDVAFEEHG